MGISKTGCSRSITKRDLDAAYKQGFMEGVQEMKNKQKHAFLLGIERAKLIKWENESEEIEKALRECGYEES